ncbi:HipA family kinase [Pseudomonas syringae]
MLQGLLKAMCSAPKIGNGVWIWSTKLNTHQRMHDTAGRFRGLCSDIPEEWCESIGALGLETLLEKIERSLMLCQSDEFWSVLK